LEYSYFNTAGQDDGLSRMITILMAVG